MFRTVRAWFFRRSNSNQDSPPGETAKKKRGKLALFVTVMHVLGALTAIHAVMSTRTSQGSIAWAISAVTFPYVAVPAYWVFGQSRFDGYDVLRRSQQMANSPTARRAKEILEDEDMLLVPQTAEESRHLELLDHLSKLPLTTHNSAELLINGEATFDAILAGIAGAEDYILFQFYILRDDGLGRELKDALLKKAAEGVRVYMLYDELGSSSLTKTYISDCRAGGIQIAPFNTTQRTWNHFRLNFRNHRKIVVIDGKIAYVGGHNVGDEYLGKDPVLSPWRDTHVSLRGPVVQCIQVPFVEDWHWATGEIPTLNWVPEKVPDGETAAACLPTGPADKLETGTLWFLQAINMATDRLWIVSPYFVPDEQLMSALQLAALRGVDVRILIPQNPDHLTVYLTALSYFQEAEEAGVKIYRYQPGFLHQKVMLIDDRICVVGTHNLDNRSMRLNFEIAMVMLGDQITHDVEVMLQQDFANSKLVSSAEYTESSLPYRFLVRLARLTAPVQ